MIDCTILKRLLHTNATKVNEHLISKGYELILNNILYKWLLSLFIHSTSEDVMLCIWDVLLIEGHIVLFKAAIALLKVIEKDILSNESIDRIMHILDTKCEEITCCKALRYYLLVKRYDFNVALIKNNRELIFPKVSETIKKIPLSRRKGFSDNDKQCNRLWPYCVKGKNERYDIKEYFVYKMNKKVNIIQKYFFNVVGGKHVTYKGSDDTHTYNSKQRTSKSFEKKYLHYKYEDDDMKEEFDMLLIQRKKHHCTNTTIKDVNEMYINNTNNNKHNHTTIRSKSCILYNKHICNKTLNETKQPQTNHKQSSSLSTNNNTITNANDDMLYYEYEYSLHLI